LQVARVGSRADPSGQLYLHDPCGLRFEQDWWRSRSWRSRRAKRTLRFRSTPAAVLRPEKQA
jgi:hypothetical protein